VNIAELLGIDSADADYLLARRLVRSDDKLLDDLIEIRRIKKLTQREVGEAMGVSQSAVARIESGERDPRLSTLRRYALAVGADVEHRAEPFNAVVEKRSEFANRAVRLAASGHGGRWVPGFRDRLDESVTRARAIEAVAGAGRAR